MKSPILTVIVHTKNEESNIKPCIDSIKDLVDEIVVVDMGSKDNTRKAAKELGAKVYKHKNVGYADPARNFGLKKAKGSWIFVLDADERLTLPLTDKIEQIVKGDKYDVVKIPRKNIIFNKWIRHSGWWPDYQVRLFKKGFVKYTGEVHTQPIYKGNLLTLKPKEELAIVHNNISSVSQLISNYDTYSEFEKYFEEKSKVSARDLFEHAENEFLFRYETEKAWKDGIHGLILSKFREFYRFIEFAKYWEKNGYKEIINLKELKDEADKRKVLIKDKDELVSLRNSKFYKLWKIYKKVRSLIYKL